MNYYELTFTYTSPVETSIINDVLAAELGEIGFESFAENENGLQGYISDQLYNVKALQDKLNKRLGGHKPMDGGMTKWYKAAQKRYSVRRYKQEPSLEDMLALESAAASLSVRGVRIAVGVEQKVFSGILGSRKRIAGQTCRISTGKRGYSFYRNIGGKQGLERGMGKELFQADPHRQGLHHPRLLPRT